MKVLLIIVLTFLLSTTHVVAKEARSESSGQATDSATMATPTPAPYLLPYPGILPDHPLWFVKAARDTLIGFLIADPLKKAEFNLLQSDKRISAGEALLKKGKTEPGVSTISKAENYFEKSVKATEEAKGSGKDVSGFLIRLSEAAQKHQEVILSLEETKDGVVRETLARERGRVEEQGKRVDSLKQKQ